MVKNVQVPINSLFRVFGMAVQFILGRSGTGKTGYCIKAIVDALLEPTDSQPLALLVPEQATYQAERSILADKRIAGYSSGTAFAKHHKCEPRLNVLSFDRLQFLLSGKNTARPGLTRLGQQMIIHRILREHKSKLKVFESSAVWPGLSQQMAKTVAELHRYAKTPEDIDQLLSELQKDEHNNLVALKFADIGLVFKEYVKFIEGKFIDPDIQLNVARRAVVEAVFAKGAKLWVDGFASFTTSELTVLAELLKTTADAQIALCLDPSKIDLKKPDTESIDPVSLFNPTERTYAELIEIVKKCKLKLAEPIILEEAVRFSSCPQLAHVKRNIFELEASKIPAADNIRIISAANARAEVQFAARQILQLVKEKKYRYRDIAVIASDIDRYQHYIRAYFDDYGIPFFIDKRKSLNQHPVVQLICSALQAVSGRFSHSDIFAYLKTGLVPIERREVAPVRDSTKGPKPKKEKISDGIDLLENYCIAFGISGGDWQNDKEWHFAGEDNQDFDEQLINQIRQEVRGPLVELRDKLCPCDDTAKKINAEKFARVIFEFLDSLGVRERIGRWIEEADKAKDCATVDEHRQFYERLVDTLDELVEVFAGQELACADFLAIISSAFSQLTLAFIPPTLDQVLVGSIERSRHPDLKAVFLIGATQKQFPTAVDYSGILTDADRHACESADFTLAATAGQMLAERQYLAYIAFTRPSQLLCVTYPLADDKGSATARSQFIANLESLFENLSEESISGEQTDIEKVNSESELADLLCGQLGKDAFRDSQLVTRDSLQASRERLGELLDDICADEPRPSEGRGEELAELGSTVRSAINYDNRAQLDKRIVKKLFGEQTRSSATKLSTYAACPYQYFARYILELEERKEFKLRPLDVGDFYHRVLDALLKRLNAEKKDFATAGDEELLKLLGEEEAKFVQGNSFISNFARRSAHNDFIIHSALEVLEDCVSGIAEMVRAGKFKASWSEVSFGEVKGSVDNLGEYKIVLSDGRGLALDGKIDRLDIAKLDGEKIAIVFDYKKRRDKPFSWTKFYHGLDMQLPIYMLAVRNASSPQYKVQDVAGAFYMPVEAPSPVLRAPGHVSNSFNYKAKGIFNGEFFQQLDSKANSGWSKLYNFFIAKEKGQYGHYDDSGALKPDDFKKVLRFTERRIVELAEEIISGKIDIKPYRLGTGSACSYCKYKQVCRFDWYINKYNELRTIGKTEALDKINPGGQG